VHEVLRLGEQVALAFVDVVLVLDTALAQYGGDRLGLIRRHDVVVSTLEEDHRDRDLIRRGDRRAFVVAGSRSG
jgi:hypothetical protein